MRKSTDVKWKSHRNLLFAQYMWEERWILMMVLKEKYCVDSAHVHAEEMHFGGPYLAMAP